MDETVFSHMLRIGTVSAVDTETGKVRVWYKNLDMASDWLSVVRQGGTGVSITPAGSHTHTIADTYTGGGSAGAVGNHTHSGAVGSSWMPAVNDTVLVIYLPVFNGNGFVLGVL